MSKYIFETRMEVRDYECDIEGIVNNANYLHYTEHTRHRFLKHAGLSFARMHELSRPHSAAMMSSSHAWGCAKRACAISSPTTSTVPATSGCASMPLWNWSVLSMDDSETVQTTTVRLLRSSHKRPQNSTS